VTFAITDDSADDEESDPLILLDMAGREGVMTSTGGDRVVLEFVGGGGIVTTTETVSEKVGMHNKQQKKKKRRKKKKKYG
jgi:hypothetical protein